MLLEVEDLHVRYGRISAVQGVSLSVAVGEAIAVVGSNGAGKSSTLAAIMGLVRPASGRIAFDGESVVGATPESIARRGMSLVPEGRHIFASLTVAENLRLGLVARGGRGDDEEAVEHALNRFEVLRRYYRTSAGKLSGGEQQQLAIARALVAGPRLLLLDEPSLGLAPLIVDLVFDTLEQLRKDGQTILLVEQNAARAIAFADRALVLGGGRVTHAGTRDDLRDELDIAAAYLGL
jgi:branched-chain amino acid transport system ATP-binding protein